MKLTLTTFLLGFTHCLLAQTGIIRGRLVDAANATLPGMTVRLQDTRYATATDNDGTFYLRSVGAGTYTFIASGIGYRAAKQTIDVKENTVTTLNIVLNPATGQLDEVVVVGRNELTTNTSTITRTNVPTKDLPQSIQVVERRTLDEQQLYRVDEALKNTAGVNLSSSWGSFNMRGFETNARSFLTNGIKGTGYPEGVFPSLANVERVEVLRGPTAVLFGNGAVSGNVNLITKQPRKTTVANATLTGGSYGLLRAQGDLSGSLNASKTIYGLVSAGVEQGGRFTRNYDNRNLQLFATAKWEITPTTSWQLNATYNRDRATSDLTPDVPTYPDRLFGVSNRFSFYGSDARYRGDSYQLQSQFEQKLSPNWTATVWLGLSQTRADRIGYGIGDAIDSLNTVSRNHSASIVETPGQTVNAFVTGSLRTGSIEHVLTAGGDLALGRSTYPTGFRIFSANNISVTLPDYAPFVTPAGKPGYFSSYEKFTNNTSGAYIQDQLTLSQRLKAVVGLRYSHYFFRYRADSVSYLKYQTYEETPENTNAFVPRVGIVYQPGRTVSVYGDYSTGFEPQYNNSIQAGGPFKPETTRQIEVGIKGDFHQSRLVPTLALYQIHKDNVLTTDPTDPTGRRSRAIGQVRSRGGEATLTGQILPNWRAIVNYSYNETKITRSNDEGEIGQVFSNSPRHIASVWTTYSITTKALKGLTVGGGYRYTGDRYITNRRVAESSILILPAYTVADIFVQYTRSMWRAQLNVNNVFDRQYAQGSYWNLSYFPGAPRTSQLTLGYSFR